tara:strand:+ start:19085 stop:19225 length:141 start_codon:yes stop_codon:yes gene_type:complete
MIRAGINASTYNPRGMGFMNRDEHELFRVASEIANFTFEQCTGEKL